MPALLPLRKLLAATHRSLLFRRAAFQLTHCLPLLLLPLAAPLTLSAQEVAPAPRREAVAVGAGKLEYLFYAHPLPENQKAPLLIVIHGDVANSRQTAASLWSQWQPLAASRAWHLALVEPGMPLWNDAAARALATLSSHLALTQPIDAQRRYLLGLGDASSQVFLSVSRTPDAFTAACALLGSVQPAIESNRLFGANTAHTPLLWIWPDESRDIFNPWLAKLRAVKFQVQTRLAGETTVEAMLAWLAQQQRELHPPLVDYETGNRTFTRAFWLEMLDFDPTQRNDALPVSRVNPGSGAYLDLGGFGFDPRDIGPGITVTWLAPNYSGPLQLNDRLVSVGGKSIEGAKGYQALMDDVRKEQPVSVMIERAGKRQRFETQILLPKREEIVTVRIRGEYRPELNEVLVISRGVTRFRIRLPDAWAPVKVSWNGQILLDADTGGCWEIGPIANPAPAPCAEP